MPMQIVLDFFSHAAGARGGVLEQKHAKRYSGSLSNPKPTNSFCSPKSQRSLSVGTVKLHAIYTESIHTSHDYAHDSSVQLYAIINSCILSMLSHVADLFWPT